MSKLLKIILFSYFLIFPFGQVGRIELSNNITIILCDVLVGLFGVVWVFSRYKEKIIYPPLASSLLCFFGVAIFSLLLNIYSVTLTQLLIGSFYLARLLIYLIFYFGVWDLIRRRIYSTHEIINSLIVIGTVVAIFGLLQFLILPDMRFLRAYGWDDHYYRLSGTFIDPGFTGIILVFTTLLIFSKNLFEKRFQYYLLGLLGVICVALTYSRASYFGLAIGMLVIFLIKRNWRIVLLSSVFFFGALYLAPKPGGEGVNLQRTSTVVYRFQNYKEALQIFQKSPVFGVGYNLYRAQRKNDTINLVHSGAGADSSILFILATTGIAGLTAFISLVVRTANWTIKNFGQFNSIAFLASASSLAIHSIFTNSIFYSFVMGWMVLLLVTIKEKKIQ